MTKETLLEFPCDFPVKIIGTNSPNFLKEIEGIVKKHVPNFKEDQLKQNLSQKGNFLAITVTVLAENQEMLDALYKELTKHPDIKMVL